MTFKQIADYKKEHAVAFAEWIVKNAYLMPAPINVKSFLLKEAGKQYRYYNSTEIYEMFIKENENGK